jgi:hypothetical protein
MPEIPGNDDHAWQLSCSDGLMTIAMPEEDARLIETRAKQAGISVEAYLRRQFDLPAEPPTTSADELRQIVVHPK